MSSLDLNRADSSSPTGTASDGANGSKPLVAPSEKRIIERIPSVRPGDTTIRVTRGRFEGFSRPRRGHLEASLDIEEPRSPFERLRRALVGTPIHSEMESDERLTKRKALAVFSSDALSSVAYTPQEALLILLAAGTGAILWSLPIAVGVVVLLAIVVSSYRQTIFAYPSGGGSYIVARSNLGEIPGLVAAAALIVGYILTVSVSIASAVDQLIAAVGTLAPFRIEIAVAAIVLVTLANLRGVRESGSIFAIPTYVFLLVMYGLIGAGLVLLSQGSLVVERPANPISPTEPLSWFLILRAFAVASAVMTGTEAISNGIPAFQAPEARNAARTIVTMAVILGTMFLGLSVLIVATGVVPTHEQTVVSLLARAVFDDGPLYFLVQAATVLILVLAANTAYADFPRLASLMARDNYAPHQLAFRGERLAFSNGILVLAAMSALLIIVFGGSTGGLLPLYAVAVFLAFTLSQAGMVRHWQRERGSRWRFKALLNGFGATATALVTLIAAVTNFVDLDHPIVAGVPIGWGAWLVLIIIPILMYLFRKVRQHYDEVARLTALPASPPPPKPLRNLVVVPIARLTRPSVLALRYAKSLSSEVTAVHVSENPELTRSLEETWTEWGQGIPLTIIDSPYRSLTRPLIRYLTELKRFEKADIVTVVLPEYVPDTWWEHFLHGQSAQFLKLLLLFTSGFVVTSVASHEHDEISDLISDPVS